MEPSKQVAEAEHLPEQTPGADAELLALRAQVAQLDRLSSIGQLTAGIMHEIKNPLNFITNYAHLSIDLLQEVEDITRKLQQHSDAEELADLLDMLKGNITRIKENGGRAERIIQSMLAQTRAEGAHFEATDLNTLLEEFSKLAYQGIRSGDKEFVVSLVYKLDPTMGRIHIAPYEFNRVVLNLVLNACYAVNERRKKQVAGYKPTITISSQKLADHVEVKIRDNGDGMSAEVQSKLFTPFFTTKPVGKGTGLGLTLSREIVHDLHKGELSVESEPGSYTEFSIGMPLTLPNQA